MSMNRLTNMVMKYLSCMVMLYLSYMVMKYLHRTGFEIFEQERGMKHLTNMGMKYIFVLHGQDRGLKYLDRREV